MIDALIAGRLHGRPVSRTAKNGSSFVTAKLRVATREDALFVNVISFSASTVEALNALDDGDSIALVGELTPKAYISRDGGAKPWLDLLAHAVLTTYHVQRKRRAASQQRSATANGAADVDDFGDEVPV